MVVCFKLYGVNVLKNLCIDVGDIGLLLLRMFLMLFRFSGGLLF